MLYIINLIILYLYLNKLTSIINLIIILIGSILYLLVLLILNYTITYLFIFIILLIYIGAILILIRYICVTFRSNKISNYSYFILFAIFYIFLEIIYYNEFILRYKRDYIENTYNLLYSLWGNKLLFIFIILITLFLLILNCINLINKGTLRILL